MRRILSLFASKEQPRSAARRAPAMFENLEDRRLLSSITVSSVLADNRGQVYINLDSHGDTIDHSSISKSSVLLYSAGADGQFGTADDVRLTENVVFNTTVNRIIVTTKVAPNVGYRVRLIAARITANNGADILDGDFHGTYPTGNGSPGGDFNALTKIDKSTTPTARVITSLGSLSIKLRGDVAPLTVNWFISRANQGIYDNSLFNSHTDNVINNYMETGIIKVGADNSYFVPSPGTVPQDPESTGLANGQWSVGMSRLPNDSDHEGNGFVFNLQKDTLIYTVFGTVTSGTDILTAIGALPTIDLAPEHTFTLADTSKVPVVNSSANHTNYQPYTDSVFMRRVAIQMRVVAMS